MRIRLILNIALFISILFFPWYLTIILGLALVALYNSYEVLAWGFFADTLYATTLPALYGFQFIFTVIFLIQKILIWLSNKIY